MKLLSKYKFQSLFALVFLTLSVFLYKSHVSRPPICIHAWAQSDRLSLAYGFLDNGFNFFKPETYCLNVQYPSKIKLENPKGITQVDFPINEYIIAGIMKFSNKYSTSVFRLYTLLYSLLGLYFLFLIFFKETKAFIVALSISLFAFTSPVYAYYQIGLIPSIPAIANIFIGSYFFFKYLELNSTKNLFFAVTFFTLATLIRLPLGIYFITAFSILILNWFKNKKIDLKQLFSFLTGFAIVIIYFAYNSKLRKDYGSVFLTEIMPAKNKKDFFIVWDAIKNNWHNQYFSVIQYYTLIVLLLTALILKLKKLIKLNNFLSQLLIFVIISLIGASAYSSLMFKQFKDHDYYFLDSYFIAIVLLFGFLLSINYNILKNNSLFIFLLVIITFFWAIIMHTHLNIRFSIMPHDRLSKSIVEIYDSYKLLDSLKVKKDAKLFILDKSNFSNVQLIHFKRKGYCLLFSEWDGNTREKITSSDYTITLNSFFTRALDSNYRETLNKLDTFFVNDKLTIYKKP